MTKSTARKTVRSLMVATGACLLTLAPGMPAGAAGVPVDKTITVPAETPSGVVAVEGFDPILIPGARDVTVRVRATATTTSPVIGDSSSFAHCRKIDKSIKLELDADATGTVDVAYTKVNAETGEAEETVTRSLSFRQEAASQIGPKIQVCLR